MSFASPVRYLHTLVTTADCPLQPKAPRQIKLSPTLSYDVRSSTAIITAPLALAALLESPSDVILRAGKFNPRRSSSLPTPHYLQPPLATPASVPHLSIVFDKQNVLHDSSFFILSTEPPSSQSPNEDGVALPHVALESSTSSCNPSLFISSTTSMPLEQTVDQVLPLKGLLEVLEQEQLREIRARGGFAGFTAQEIECWVAAGRAQ